MGDIGIEQRTIPIGKQYGRTAVQENGVVIGKVFGSANSPTLMSISKL